MGHDFEGARRKHPYSIIELCHDDFFDLKDLKEKTISGDMSKDSEQKSVSWMEIKRLKFQKHERHILVKTGYSEESFRILPLEGPPSRRRAKQPGHCRPYNLRKKYQSRLSISSAKKKDLLSLCSTGAIPPAYQEFWRSLSTSDRVIDCLPEPDINDGDVTDDDD